MFHEYVWGGGDKKDYGIEKGLRDIDVHRDGLYRHNLGDRPILGIALVIVEGAALKVKAVEGLSLRLRHDLRLYGVRVRPPVSHLRMRHRYARHPHEEEGDGQYHRGIDLHSVT